MVRVFVLAALAAVLCNVGQSARAQQGFADDIEGRNYQTSPTSELGPFNSYAPANGSFPGPSQLNPELLPPGYSSGYPAYRSAYSKYTLNNGRYTSGYRGYANEFGGYSPYSVNYGWGVPWAAPYVNRYYRGGYGAPCYGPIMPGTILVEPATEVPQEVLRLPDGASLPMLEERAFDVEAPPLPESEDVVFPLDDFST